MANVECKTCDANTYQADHKTEWVNHDNKTDCLSCPRDSEDNLVMFAAQTKSKTVQGCSACPGGKTAGTTACENCDSGQFSSEDTALKCDKCKVGQFQNKAGQAACIDCIPGMYQDEEGENKCRECQEGKHEAEPAAGIIVKRDTPTVCTECKYKCFFISFHL